MDIYCGVRSADMLDLAEAGRINDVRDMAQAVEALGVAGVGIPDHITDPGWSHRGPGAVGGELGGRQFPDPFAMLGYLAAVTSRVKLFTRILVVPYRQPFAIAHAFATVDVLSAGRVMFGGAAGYEKSEFDAFGIPRSRRASLTDEYIEVILGLWEHASFSYKGRYLEFENQGLLVRPVQQPRPPVLIGGHSHFGVVRAVKYGDIWSSNCSYYPPGGGDSRNSLTRQEFAEEVEWARAECSKMGRAPLHMMLSTGPGIQVTDKAAHTGRRKEEMERFSKGGTPDELIEEFRWFKEAGADSFYVGFAGNTTAEWLATAERFMREVAPALD